MNQIRLNNGVDIPQLGFGTAAIGAWQQDDDYVKNVILDAIKIGYRHLDTASVYGNERSVGKAIKESGIPRNEFFITSKVWVTEFGRTETEAAFERSLARLETDYLDLYLIHWPNPEKTQATWQAMENLYDQQRIRALGLSNFRASDIEAILAFAKHKPTYNQLELHPYFNQAELVKFSQQHNLVVASWSPLGTGSWSDVASKDKPLADATIAKIAEEHGVTPAQVIVKWNLQQGRIVIPKSETLKNIQHNFDVNSFSLSNTNLNAIDQLNRNTRFGGDPNTVLDNALNVKVPK